jgi:hypothetical protein
MKKSSLLYIALFILSTAIGYPAGHSLGMRFFPEHRTHLALHPPFSGQLLPTPVATLPNGQEIIVLILIDEVGAKSPNLEGIWLISYVADHTTLNFLPVHPSGSSMHAESTDDLLYQFSITGNPDHPLLSPKFLEALKQHVPWWSGYLLIDNSFLTRLADIWFAGRQLSEVDQDPQEILSNLTSPTQDALSAITAQFTLFQEMCWAASRQKEGISLSRMFNDESTLILSDLSSEQVISTLEGLHRQMGKFSCEFPTLANPGTIAKP